MSQKSIPRSGLEGKVGKKEGRDRDSKKQETGKPAFNIGKFESTFAATEAGTILKANMERVMVECDELKNIKELLTISLEQLDDEIEKTQKLHNMSIRTANFQCNIDEEELRNICTQNADFDWHVKEEFFGKHEPSSASGSQRQTSTKAVVPTTVKAESMVPKPSTSSQALALVPYSPSPSSCSDDDESPD